MAGVNKAILVGRLGKDPQLDYTSSGTARCRFSLATSDNYTDRDGKRQENTSWHNIVLWARLAEVAGEYLSKGRMVYIEGRINYHDWQTEDGQTKYITEIVGNQMQLLGGKGDDQPDGDVSQRDPEEKPARGKGKPSNPPRDEPPEDDDLPF